MKFKITLLALASAACLTACNDDFFDQVPDDRITIEQVFQRTSYSEKYLATVYSYILNEAHRTSPIPWDPCSDDLDVTYDREDYNSYQINLGNWSASSDYYEFWSHFYRGIRSATYFIQHIGDNQEMLNDPTRGPLVVEQYKNEARFLRAWFYYNLLRQYGPCVLLGDEVLPGDLDRDDVKMNLPRSSYDECVDYIVGELDDIIDNERLPLHFTSQADKDYGRATLVMCMGLKSRVLLLAASPQFNGNPAYANVVNNDGKHLFATERDPEKWKRAADAAKAIIDLNIFDLYKEYHTDGTLDPYMSCRNVFLENWNSEVMMVRIYNNLSSWERSASPRQFSGYESMGATQQLVDAFRMNDGSAITAEQEKGFSTQEYKDAKSGWVFAPAGTRNMFVNREPRFYVNICFNGAYWIGDQKTRIQLYYTGGSGKKGTWDYPRSGYIAIKNVSPSSNPLNNNYIKRPFLMMRYAEMLLNYVEALNEYDPGNPDIEKYLNLIRERGGLGPVQSGLSQELMREQIRLERRIELCFEQLRYFDTRRWLIAEQPGEDRSLCVIRVQIDGKDLYVASTHLDHLSGDASRLVQATEIRRIRDTELEGDLILCGDLNAIPSSNVIATMTSFLTNTGPIDQYTFPSDDPSRKIDYIMYAPIEHFGVQNCQVVSRGDQQVGGVDASDHRPVIADIRFQTEEDISGEDGGGEE